MTVSYQLTAKDFRDVLFAHRKRNVFIRWLIRLIIAAALLVLMMVTIYSLVGRGDARYYNILQNLLPLVFLAVMWIAILFGLPYYSAYRQFNNMPSVKGQITLDISDSGLRLHSQHTDSTVAWPAFVRWLEAKPVFALYTSPCMFLVVPKRAFTDEQLSGFRETVGSHITTH
jgi:YcxB-like protein